MIRETFLHSVRHPTTIKQKVKAVARHSLLSTLGWLKHDAGQPRLQFIMSHYVFDDQQEAFRRQIQLLQDMGEFVSTDDALAMLRDCTPIDGRYFHLSFDDGLDCLMRNAVPVLEDAGIPALVFVNSALAGTPQPQERQFWEKATNYAQPLAVMDWKTLAAASCIEVGAHTRTHVRLSDISDNETALLNEITGCKMDIEAALGRPCRFFAWPFGRHSDIDEASMAVIREAGYEASFGAFRGSITPGETNIMMIPRHHFEPQWPTNHLRYFLAHG